MVALLLLLALSLTICLVSVTEFALTSILRLSGTRYAAVMVFATVLASAYLAFVLFGYQESVSPQYLVFWVCVWNSYFMIAAWLWWVVTGVDAMICLDKARFLVWLILAISLAIALFELLEYEVWRLHITS